MGRLPNRYPTGAVGPSEANVTPRSTARELLVAGHVNVDRFLGVERFPAADRTEPVRSERTELGGTATNLARVAARLGVRVGLLARVGDGFPPEFRRRLLREKIDLRGLRWVPGEPTPCCTILEVPDGTTRTLIQQGPMSDASRAELPGAWAAEYSWLHLSTGNPAFYLQLARWARARKMHVAVDPAQEIFYRWDRDSLLEALASAELFFGNRREVARASRWVGGGMSGLLSRVPLVVRTEGPDGATAFSRAGKIHVDAPRPRRIRTLVGAGDSFRGGFYAAWLQGLPLARCLRTAVRSANTWIEDGPGEGGSS